MKKTIIICFVIIFMLLGLTGCSVKEGNDKFKIVTSFYPMYIIALNITDGAENISLENMTDTNVGCLHDYTLKTSDLIKVEDADVLIINGLGIESFTDKILQNNSKIAMIDASKNIIINSEEPNAHVWMDIDYYILQVEEVAEELKRVNPENSSVYESNKQKYVKELQELKLEINPKTNKEKVISFSDSLNYIANTFNLDILTIEQDHEQSSLSAEKLKEVVDYAKKNNVKRILVDNITSIKNAKSLANEIGGEVYVLNSGLSGNLEKNAYKDMIRQNAKQMEE